MLDNNINWYTISKKGKNFENLLISSVARAFVEFSEQPKTIRKFGPLYVRYYRQFDTHRDVRKEEVENYISEAKERESQEPGSLLAAYEDYYQMLQAAKAYANRLVEFNYSNYTNGYLAKAINDFCYTFGRLIWYDYNYYLLQYLADDLFVLVQKKTKTETEANELFEVLSQAQELSLLQQEKRDLLKIVGKIKAGLALDDGEAMKLIQAHLNKYNYMGFHYFRGWFWQIEDIKTRLREWLSKDYQSELNKIESLAERNHHWQDSAQQYKFTEQEKLLVKTIKLMAYTTNLFDEVWNYAVGQGQALFREIEKRLHVNYQELIEMDFKEIVMALKEGGKIKSELKQRIKERLEDSALFLLDNHLIIISGQELKKYYQEQQQLQKQTKANSRELIGQAASPGFAQGKVAIVRSVEDLDKVKMGDIMVARATVPSFVPAMERAAGIVTELGGLLSHAAIVARELHIPCVVGIDDLLDLVSDGETIIVDATNGIIRKI